jgi:hypothetical protein
MPTDYVKQGEIESCNKATREHAANVEKLLRQMCTELAKRGKEHDKSKMEAPEVDYFAVATPKLKGLTYGSEEYKACLREIKPAIDHHNKVNRHHPEHHKNGVDDMTLIDLMEMICDWIAASKRHADGDVLKSIEINKKRHNLSDQLAIILKNTVEALV